MQIGMLRTMTLIWFSGALLVADEPPRIDRISPPGIQRGTSLDVKLIGKAGESPLSIWSTHSELTFVIPEKQDSATVTAPADTTPGIHWMRFYNEHGAGSLIPFEVGVIPEVASVEPNNDHLTAQEIQKSTVLVNGILEKSGDVDVYAMSMKSGQTLVASMKANRELASPMDGVLQILDSAGTVVAHNDDDHALDPLITYTAPTDGTYYVRTFAFPSAPNSTIALAGGATFVYRLTLTTGAFIDYVAPMVVDAASQNKITVHGWNIPETQRLITLNSFPHGESRWISDGFANSFRVSSVPAASVVETANSPQKIAPDETVTGCISADNEVDTFIMDGKKGDKLTISAHCRSLYSQLDPVLTITDETGRVLKEADDRSRQDLDSEAAVTLRQDGPITIKLRDRFGSGGARFFYVLTASRTTPQFAATIASDVYVLKPEEPLEVPISIARKNGFAETIKVTVTGLPEGISVEPAESLKEGDTAKTVKLKLTRTPEAKAFSGEIKITATPESSAEQTITFAVPNSSEKFSSVWLTVPKISDQPEKPAE